MELRKLAPLKNQTPGFDVPQINFFQAEQTLKPKLAFEKIIER